MGAQVRNRNDNGDPAMVEASGVTGKSMPDMTVKPAQNCNESQHLYYNFASSTFTKAPFLLSSHRSVHRRMSPHRLDGLGAKD